MADGADAFESIRSQTAKHSKSRSVKKSFDSPTGTLLLEQLAHLLLARYRAVSGSANSRDKPFRTIVVVGAGASHAACGLPLGKELAKRVEKGVRAEGTPDRLIKAELDRLEQVFQLKPSDFETRLLALGRFDPATVLKVLCENCDVAHYPSLTYEILAHLMKHGFLDAIINFNFDELLDQAIDEEVGAEGHTKIVRDGSWARRLRTDGNARHQRFDLPLYIKPHGTVGDPASLRFTRDAYFALPPDMRRLMRLLISGAPASDFAEDTSIAKPHEDHQPVLLLVLGHAMQSFEFNKLLESCPEKSRLYVAVLGKNAKDYSQCGWNPRMVAMASDRLIPIGEESNALDEFMRKVWSTIEGNAESEAKSEGAWLGVRGIERHGLMAHLFEPTRRDTLLRRTHPVTPEQREALENYYMDRLVVETTLAIAKSRGFIDLRELHRGRAGLFYDLLRDHLLRHPPRRGPHPPIISSPIAEFLGSFDMHRRDASGEAYWHSKVRPFPKSHRKEVAERLTLDRDTYESEVIHMLEGVCEKLFTKHRKRTLATPPGSQLMTDALRTMYKGGEVEIAPALPASMSFKFQDARAIRTIAQLRHETYDLIAAPWDLLLCVAESGKWLLDHDPAELAARPVGLIVADMVESTFLKKLPNVRVKRLPWYLHNRHMTIRLAKEGGNAWKPKGAIYFERRYRSSRISPVVLSDSRDLERVMEDFTVYWLKAERLARNQSDEIRQDSEALLKAQRTMLTRLSAVRRT